MTCGKPGRLWTCAISKESNSVRHKAHTNQDCWLV
jgi:hypothetical protein